MAHNFSISKSPAPEAEALAYRDVSSLIHKMVEAARIACAVILNKIGQLMSFDGADFGIFVGCAKWREWSHEGPQNGPQFLKDFWGRRRVLILLALARILLQCYYLRFSRYLLYSKYRHHGEYSCKFAIFTVQ
ncbi:MAG: hypothetical protein Q8T09_14220 [Candidatus Melainabacteria bacterium]|nr:hypothetical protein [Candidatus Melainabacteria bacterium]